MSKALKDLSELLKASRARRALEGSQSQAGTRSTNVKNRLGDFQQEQERPISETTYSAPGGNGLFPDRDFVHRRPADQFESDISSRYPDPPGQLGDASLSKRFDRGQNFGRQVHDEWETGERNIDPLPFSVEHRVPGHQSPNRHHSGEGGPIYNPHSDDIGHGASVSHFSGDRGLGYRSPFPHFSGNTDFVRRQFDEERRPGYASPVDHSNGDRDLDVRRRFTEDIRPGYRGDVGPGYRSPSPPYAEPDNFQLNRGREGEHRLSGLEDRGHPAYGERSQRNPGLVFGYDSDTASDFGHEYEGRFNQDNRKHMDRPNAPFEPRGGDDVPKPTVGFSGQSKADPGEFITLSSYRRSCERTTKSVSRSPKRPSPDRRTSAGNSSRKRSNSPAKRRSGSGKRNRSRTPERKSGREGRHSKSPHRKIRRSRSPRRRSSRSPVSKRSPGLHRSRSPTRQQKTASFGNYLHSLANPDNAWKKSTDEFLKSIGATVAPTPLAPTTFVPTPDLSRPPPIIFPSDVQDRSLMINPFAATDLLPLPTAPIVPPTSADQVATKRSPSPALRAQSRSPEKQSGGMEELFWQALMTKKLPALKKYVQNVSETEAKRNETLTQGDTLAHNPRNSDSNDVTVVAQTKQTLRPQQEQHYSQPQSADSENSIWRMLAKQANLEEVIEKRDQEKQVSTSAIARSLNPDVLKFGNYCLVIWDALLWAEEGNQTPHICQIAATIPRHGEDFFTYIHPEIKDRPPSYPFTHVKNRNWILDFQKTSAAKLTLGKLRPAENPLRMFHALEKFLKFLQDACQRVRPAYDGVVLLCYDQELVQHMVRAFAKHPNLKKRIENVIKGMGDLTSYLAEFHAEKFQKQDTRELNLSMTRVIRLVTKRPYTLSSISMLNAADIGFVFQQLLEAEPTYANFYRRFMHPLTSKLIRRLASVKTQQERLVMFAPLRRFLVKGLAEQRDQLVELGMYDRDDPDNFLKDPEEIAERMVKALILNGFDLDVMLDRFKLQGVDALELELRTSFMSKMVANQDRQIVEQTIRSTKLIVSFFQIHGQKTLEILNEESKLTLPPPMNMPFESWQPFDDLIQMFMSHFEGKAPRSVLEKEVTTLISCFVGVGLTHDKLVEAYKTREDFEDSLGQLLHQLCFSNVFHAEDFKRLVLIYLSRVEDLIRKKQEAKAKKIDVVEMISDDSESSNPWLPFKNMHDLFVESFKQSYKPLEAVRGSKLVISSLIQAGMIHETMEYIFKMETRTRPFGLEEEMKSRFTEILNRNYPNIPSVPIPVDDISDFLFFYCKKAFGNGSQWKSDQHSGNTNNKIRENEHQYQLQESESPGEGEGEATKQNEALAACRRKLAEILPIEETSEEFKEYKLRLNSLCMLTKFIEHKLEPTVMMCGGTQEQVQLLARHIQEVLAATDFNYLKLKQLYFKGGSVLSDELAEAIGDKGDIIPPGMTILSLANMIYAFYLETFSKFKTQN